MKNMFLALVLLVSATVFGATSYTPQYDSNGTFHAIAISGSNVIIMANANNDPNMQYFTAWLAAQTPPLTVQSWLAANPCQTWGAIPLAQYQQQQTAALKAACDALTVQQYPITNMIALTNMYATACSGIPAAGATPAVPPMPNRAAYLQKVLTWSGTVTALYYQQVQAIAAATTQAQVAAVTWTTQLAAIQAADPLVTIAGALAIQN